MSENYKPAGTYELVSFTIMPFEGGGGTDIKLLIQTWEIIESMLSGAVRGSAKVYDTIGLLYDFPIRGQEMIEVIYKDWRDVELTEKFVVYSVTDVKPFTRADDSGMEYTLSFVSVGKFVSDKYDIRRCIASGSGSGRAYVPISQQAEVVFRDYFRENGSGTEKDLYVTPSDGPQKVIIPALKPEDAMHFLSRRAWSAAYSSQNYRFFETRLRYYFANVEDLIAFGQDNYETVYFYSTGLTDITPEGEQIKMQNILEYEFPSYSNSHLAMLQGHFFRKTNELHLSERIEIVNEYEHLNEYSNYVYPDVGGNLGFIYSDDFVNNQINRFYTNYVFRDYPGPDDPPTARQRPATYYPDIYNAKGASIHGYGSTRMNIKIFGNNQLTPGTIIPIEIPQQRTQRTEHEERNGSYMIESIRNVFHELMYYQEISLVKGALGVPNAGSGTDVARSSGGSITQFIS